MEFIGSKIFDNIQTDERVTSNLQYCLYCKVISSKKSNAVMVQIDYKIGLLQLNPGIKQCPACKAVYILNDPTQ